MALEPRTDPAAAPRVFTIAPGCSFLDALAAQILRETGPDPMALSDVHVLLPTRRACRALGEAFLRATPQGRALLLPRMSPLGDIDTDQLALMADDGPTAPQVLDLPPPVAPMRRRMLLTRLILAGGGLALNVDQAARLAGDLARLIDLAATHRLGFDRLAALVPEELARHWQLTLDFLRIVTEEWPKILADHGAVDPATHRNRALEAQAAQWRAHPPAHPVIAAGSTGSLPATAELIATIARLPRGAVVLPGLDRDMDGESWDAVDDSHPQVAMKQLLATIGIDRRQVADWPAPPPRPDRRQLLREVMRPSATTDAWLALETVPTGTVDALIRVDAAGEREEAGAVALMLRQALEQPGRTAALVTADRSLARRVAAELERWGIGVDDSGGRPLTDTPAGTFLRLAAAVPADGFAPVGLLSLLKHPLAGAGLDPAALRAQARRLELAVLRGPRPRPGLAALRDLVQARAVRDGRPLVALIDRLAAMAAPFAALLDRPEAPPAALLAAHVAFAESLAATDGGAGPGRLWRHEDGEAAATALAELAEALDDFPPIAPDCYPGLIDAVLDDRVVRPRYGRHPRLSIWGPLEARLLHADRLILAGLNEGTWPRTATADPWMSRPMQAGFGLPSPERRVGLAAHDFAQALAAPDVVLTRAARVGGTPTVPSRWLMRLETVAKAANLAIGHLDHKRPDPWLDWFAALDAAQGTRSTPPPAPRPPQQARPDRLSVSDVAMLMADPYAYYARQILKLEPLEPLEADPGAAERGQIVHAILARFLTMPAEPGQELALDRLLAVGREAFAVLADFPAVVALWWPRFVRVAEWFVRHEAEWRRTHRLVACERDGCMTLPGRGRTITLRARADRIDRTASGGLAILDYKTGQLPSKKQVSAGRAPQLPLEGAIALAGGFDGIAPAPVDSLVYWRLSGGSPPGEPRDATKEGAAAAIEDARSGLARLIASFEAEQTPYLSRPWRPPGTRDGPYDHLARLAEWSVAGDGDEA